MRGGEVSFTNVTLSKAGTRETSLAGNSILFAWETWVPGRRCARDGHQGQALQGRGGMGAIIPPPVWSPLRPPLRPLRR